jgi:hypothetical protein
MALPAPHHDGFGSISAHSVPAAMSEGADGGRSKVGPDQAI